MLHLRAMSIVLAGGLALSPLLTACKDGESATHKVVHHCGPAGKAAHICGQKKSNKKTPATKKKKHSHSSNTAGRYEGCYKAQSGKWNARDKRTDEWVLLDHRPAGC